MDEDRLSPLLGRLIDQAKAAAAQAVPGSGPAEGLALLLADETIVSAHSVPGVLQSAAEQAIAQVWAGQAIEAAAVATISPSLPTLLPSDESRRALEAVNPDLPLVVKYRGRWVVKFLSDLPERCDQE
jgi:hypothetical protein